MWLLKTCKLHQVMLPIWTLIRYNLYLDFEIDIKSRQCENHACRFRYYCIVEYEIKDFRSKFTLSRCSVIDTRITSAIFCFRSTHIETKRTCTLQMGKFVPFLKKWKTQILLIVFLVRPCYFAPYIFFDRLKCIHKMHGLRPRGISSLAP